MATYKQIQAWVKQQYGFVPATCWIAPVKYMSGLPMRNAPNCKGAGRVKPSPPRYAFDFWWEYTCFCRQLAAESGVSMRVLDRALWQYSVENRGKTN